MGDVLLKALLGVGGEADVEGVAVGAKAHPEDDVVEQIGTAPNRVRYTMNGFVISVGCYVRPLMKVRRNRPLFFIDIAVHRDLDPELNDI